MIGAKDFDVILQKAKAVGARIWFIGDTGQNSSISAGALLKLMMHNGATVHRIDQIIRQQDQQQNQAVQLIAKGHSLEALDVLEKARCIHECANTDHKISAAVDHFMNLPYRKGRPLVVVGTNAEREEFTDQLRFELLAAGRLKNDIGFIQLKDRNLSDAQKDRAENYNKGDLISFRIKHRLYTQIKTHVPYKVLGIEGKKLSVQSPGGRILKLDPGEFEGKEVYTAHRSSIAEGDYLRFTSTHRQKGIYANTSLKCTKIKNGIATVEDRQGNTHDLNLSKPLKLDHDWATTTYRSQGTTNAHTIYISSLNPTSARESFYVGISRQTHKLAIFTEDINRLRGWITQSFAQENAVDLLSDPHAGWKPYYEGIERPHHLDERTWKEMQESGIHPSLLTHNHLRSVAPDKDMDIRNNPLVSALLEREFDKSRYGAGQEVTKKMQAKLNGITKVDGQWVADPNRAYNRIAEGGGWIGYGGTDLFSMIHGGSTPFEYCQVKPYTPRIIEGDEVKYETPKGVDQQVFLPDIPDEIAELIYKRNAINPTPEERAHGAWFVADQYNLPIVLTEGLKKTWASLSQGHLTVGLPGVTALYRAKDEFDNRLEFRELTAYGEALAKPGREIIFAFDEDEKPKTIANVRRDLVRTAELLTAKGCVCKTARWSTDDGKGLDDLIVKCGPQAYNVAIANRRSVKGELTAHYRNQYKYLANKVQRRLGDIPQARVDLEVYRECREKHEVNDAYRFISYSDHVLAMTEEEREQYLRALHQSYFAYVCWCKTDEPIKLDDLTEKLVESKIRQQEQAVIIPQRPEQSFGVSYS